MTFNEAKANLIGNNPVSPITLNKSIMTVLAEYEALKTSFENLQQQLLIDGHTIDCACVQAASIDCSCGKR